MSPEDQIRMLLEENARLRAQIAGRPSVWNQYGQTPQDLAEADEVKRWQDEQSYMGQGMSDLLYRQPKQKKAPSPYLKKE